MASKSTLGFLASLLSCRAFSEVASFELDRPLTRKERFLLRFHGLYCAMCRKFQRQITVLHKHSKVLHVLCDKDHSHDVGALSDGARERIKKAMAKR